MPAFYQLTLPPWEKFESWSGSQLCLKPVHAPALPGKEFSRELLQLSIVHVEMSSKKPNVLPAVEQIIFLIRGHKVMLSTDLARLYDVPPKVLIQAITRNFKRFPSDFMFRITLNEAKASRSQFVTLKRGQNIKHAPYAFTEQGVAMLSSVLRSPRAIQVNIAIMRAFVKLRETLALHKNLAAKLQKLEREIEGHDDQIQSIFNAIRRLMAPSQPARKRIGFQP